jgi:hypothetical protein
MSDIDTTDSEVIYIEKPSKGKKPLSDKKVEALKKAQEKLKLKREMDKLKREEESKKRQEEESDFVLRNKFSKMFEEEFSKLKASMATPEPTPEVKPKKKKAPPKKKVTDKKPKKVEEVQEVAPQPIQPVQQLSKVDLMFNILKKR